MAPAMFLAVLPLGTRPKAVVGGHPWRTALWIATAFGLKALSGTALEREADPKGAGQDRPASAMTSLMCRSGAPPR